MRIRRIRVFIWIVSIFLIAFLIFSIYKFYQSRFFTNENAVEVLTKTVKEETKRSKSVDSIFSKSVLLGYSNSDNLTLFSAFISIHSPDEQRQVVVILSSYGYYNRRVYCRLFDKDRNEISQQATVVFPEYTVKCDLYENSKFVGISINKKDVIHSMIPIIDRKTSQNRKSELTICLAPIFGKSPKSLMLIEFIEYYKLQGADKFLVYSFDHNLHVDKILDIYSSESEFEVISIGNDTKCLNRHRCRHEMQLQDCIYRSNGVSKWVATVDLDERIMLIDQKKPITDLLKVSDSTNFGELRFRCQWTLRYSEVPADEQVTIDEMPMLKWHNTSHVAPQNHTTKSIVRPEMVDSMGVHGVQKFTSQNFKVRLVEPDEAVVRHYRLIEGWSFFLKEAETFGSFDQFYLDADLEKKLRRNVDLMIRKFKQ